MPPPGDYNSGDEAPRPKETSGRNASVHITSDERSYFCRMADSEAMGMGVCSWRELTCFIYGLNMVNDLMVWLWQCRVVNLIFTTAVRFVIPNQWTGYTYIKKTLSVVELIEDEMLLPLRGF